MALFNTVYCSECGEKAGVILRAKLTDGNYICGSCMRAVPNFMYSSVLEHYTLDDYRDFKEYVRYSNNSLRPLFCETKKYYTIHIDEENWLFYLGNKVDESTLFFRFSDILNFDLIFAPEEFKEGITGDKVRGNILFELSMLTPYFNYEEKLDSHVSAKAKKKLFGSKIVYENPKGMDEFYTAFITAWLLSSDSEEDDAESVPESVSELQQAMALFMLDSIENTSLDELKAQRNRLIKAFHPDRGSEADNKYAQKINGAYAVLKKHLV